MENGLPNPLDRAIFLADAHLNQDDIHCRRFLEMAAQAAAGKVPMFLLGDMFDLWFGNRGLTFGYQRPIIDRLRELRRGGFRLYYIEGNRDFYLKSEHEGTTFDLVSEGDLRATIGGKRVFLSHGDTVNKADFSYRFWKGISKSRIANRAVAHLPAWFFLPLADRVERKLKRYNLRHKESFPEAECREYALRRFDAGADIIVLGHFHQERLEPQNREPQNREPQNRDVHEFFRSSGTEMNAPGGVLAVLPSWKEAYRYFYVTAEGAHGFRAFVPGEPLVP
ncbi:MAG: lpxH [Deltaproteobacteria bacterium]|nr:lpxH [Deltaproteobacteria bacterium]